MTPCVRTTSRIVVVVCAVFGTYVVAHAQSLDTSFDPGANNLVYAFAAQPGGKLSRRSVHDLGRRRRHHDAVTHVAERPTPLRPGRPA